MKSKKIELFECYLCHIKLKSKAANLRRHMALHGPGLKSYKCLACKNHYQTKSNLRVHWNKKHHQQQFEFKVKHQSKKSMVLVNALRSIVTWKWVIRSNNFPWFISVSKEVQYIPLFDAAPKFVENAPTYMHSLLSKNESPKLEFGQPAQFQCTASNNVLNFGNTSFGSNLPSFEKLAKKANFRSKKAIYSYNFIKSITEISIEINFDRPEFGQMNWQK